MFAAAAAIGLGTWFGGWRIIHTLGRRVTEIKPAQGFSANTGAATVILAASHVGFPLSTTHVAAGSVVGSGLGAGAKVEWRIARNMVIAWGLTLPGAGLVGAAAAWVAADGIGGTAGVLAVALVALALSAGLWFLQRGSKVSHHDLELDPKVAPAAPAPVELAAPPAEGKRKKRKKATA